MAKDYIVFLHGVNVRETPENEKKKHYTYADDLFRLINAAVNRKDPTRNCVKVPLYWGDVNQRSLNELLAILKSSSQWNQLWFKDFRTEQLLQFVGDAGLYISRLIGSMAADQLKEQVFEQLVGYEPDDRLHLVTHSWGTVILFDILFASRWDNPNIPGFRSVQALRNQLYGIGDDPKKGIRLGSIQTMGSPIALFSLITITGKNEHDESTHDIIPGLEDLLKNIVQGDRKLPWINFVHPGDPIAWPLDRLLSRLVAGSNHYVDIQDLLTRGSGFWEFIAQLPPIRQTFLALANGGNAHGSYWHNKEVAKRIAANIVVAR